MDTTEILVLISGGALILFVLWYFFGEREQVAAETNESGLQEVKVTVKGGYSPDVIVVKKNMPVRLNFYRDETSFQRADKDCPAAFRQKLPVRHS